MDIGKRIKQYRQQKKMTQEKLASLADISRIALGNYERGERTPTVDIFLKIAKALKVSTDELLGYESNFDKYVNLLRSANFVADKQGNRVVVFNAQNTGEYFITHIFATEDEFVRFMTAITPSQEYKNYLNTFWKEQFNNREIQQMKEQLEKQNIGDETRKNYSSIIYSIMHSSKTLDKTKKSPADDNRQG